MSPSETRPDPGWGRSAWLLWAAALVLPLVVGAGARGAWPSAPVAGPVVPLLPPLPPRPEVLPQPASSDTRWAAAAPTSPASTRAVTSRSTVEPTLAPTLAPTRAPTLAATLAPTLARGRLNDDPDPLSREEDDVLDALPPLVLPDEDDDALPGRGSDEGAAGLGEEDDGSWEAVTQASRASDQRALRGLLGQRPRLLGFQRLLEHLEKADDGSLWVPPRQHGADASLPARQAALLLGGRPENLTGQRRIQAAHLLMTGGEYLDAWNLFATVPRALLGEDGAIEAAMAALSSDRAADGLAHLGEAPPDSTDRAAYWWARLAQRAGRDDLARPALTALAGREPLGYYGVWAAARLRDAGTPLAPVVLDGRPTRPTFDVPVRAVALAELSSLVERHGRTLPWLERALELARAGSSIAATDQLRLAYKFRPGTFDRADEVALARVAQGLGDETLALRIEPPEDLRAYHRQAFRDLVIAAAARHGVDPDLVWAVMVRESAFHPNAASPAGARGLMQVMPQTGYAIARAQRVSGFRPSQLFEPDTSIDFGTFLLSVLLRKYEGRVALALAAYNAGEEPVDEWLALRRDAEPDVFAEQIPYPETHRYVQRVLTSLAIYQAPL